MSTFSGRLPVEGFEKVCIDNFMPENYCSSSFFLSHFHYDHMRGIWESSFHRLFEGGRSKMYCSDITRRFILKCDDINIPPEKIIALEAEGTEVQLTNNTWIKVTWLPAGHCPGSIMLLFEGSGCRLLYTGDFRLSMSDVSLLKPLHFEGEPMPVDHLFLDTTFATRNYLTFPLRQDSLLVIKNFIDDWFAKNKQNRVAILSSACIGIEYLMIQLCEIYKQKVHVSNEAYNRFLSALDMLEQVITTDVTTPKIHFCNVKRCETCFRSVFQEEFLLLIKPSALYFNQEVIKQNGNYVFDTRASILRVAYSSHSSCQELIDFVRYFNPKKIHASVIPPFLDPLAGRQQFLDDFLQMCWGKKDDEIHEDTDDNDDLAVSDMELLCNILIKNMTLPVELPPSPDEELIESLGLSTPT